MAQENRMPRQSNDRDRDEYGRFTSDDDDRRGSYSSRGGRDYDDDRGSRGRGHERDEEGRFTSGRGGGRDYDDDRGGRGGGGRGQGGWFGDPQGHSEASRRGSEERDNGGRSYRSEERSYRSRDDDDYDRGGRGGGRGQGGWFGDPEGHAEAARRGWDERDGGGSRSRGRDDDDDRGGRGGGRGGGRERDDEGRFTSGRGGSRGRDDDDDRGGRGRGGGGGRGQGGWFGDSEGHAEAARRGWEDRR
jgi:hypothetical protein